jgi:SAM-dependent methyltransferase
MSDTRKADTWTELAAPVWDSKLAELFVPMLDGLKIDSTVLVAECRTGTLTRAIAQALPELPRLMSVEPDRDYLDAARAAKETRVPTFFQTQSIRTLGFATDVFGLAVGGVLGGSTADVLNSVAELARVTKPSGWVLFAYTVSASLPLVDELANESALALGGDWDETLDLARERRPTPERVAEHLKRIGLSIVDAGSQTVPVPFESGEALWSHPVALDAFRPFWVAIGDTTDERKAFAADLKRRIAMYYSDALTSDLVFEWLLARVEEPAHESVEEADVIEAHAVGDEAITSLDEADILGASGSSEPSAS